MMRIEWTGKLWSDPLSIVLGTRNSSSRAAWGEIEKGGRKWGWGTGEGGEEIDDEERGANPPGSFYRKRPALVLGAVGCRATR